MNSTTNDIALGTVIAAIEAVAVGGALTTGSMIIGAAGVVAELDVSTDGYILVGNGTTATSVAVSGDVTITNAGVVAIASGVIINADIKSDAAIAYSKLATLASARLIVGSAGGVATAVDVTGDVTISNAGVTAIASDVIINTDVKSDAAIAFSKLAALTTGSILIGSASVATALDIKTDGYILVGNGTTATSVAVSGDITLSNAGVVAIASDVIVDGDIKTTAAISLSKLASLASGRLIVGSAGNVATAVDVTGDVTISSTGVTAIGAGKVLEAMVGVPTTNALGLKRIARVEFDPSLNSGERTIGAHTLGVTIPANAIIIRSWYDVCTTFADGVADLATIALHCETADNIVAAITIADGSNVWDQGLHEAISTGTTATAKKLTTGGLLTATVGAVNLTAGKLVLFVEYVVTDVNA